MTTDTSSAPTSQRHAGRTMVARAWPTGRPIYAYTPAEIADGVDCYTRRLKAARRAKAGDGDA